MKRMVLGAFIVLSILLGGEMGSIYDIKVKTIDGKEVTLQQYQGRVILIVNVASECGFPGRYEGLQKLHATYHEKGLSILGFPCNQFGAQEPKGEAEIKSFCITSFGVKFDMFSKIEVNGEHTHPLYRLLKERAKGTFGSESIKWNFTKFLVDRKGNVIARYASATKPQELEKEIEKLLK